MSGNRTRVNCLEGSYANHYTNIAWWRNLLIIFIQNLLWHDVINLLDSIEFFSSWDRYFLLSHLSNKTAFSIP